MICMSKLRWKMIYDQENCTVYWRARSNIPNCDGLFWRIDVTNRGQFHNENMDQVLMSIAWMTIIRSPQLSKIKRACQRVEDEMINWERQDESIRCRIYDSSYSLYVSSIRV